MICHWKICCINKFLDDVVAGLCYVVGAQVDEAAAAHVLGQACVNVVNTLRQPGGRLEILAKARDSRVRALHRSRVRTLGKDKIFLLEELQTPIQYPLTVKIHIEIRSPAFTKWDQD